MPEIARAYGYAALVGWYDMRHQYTWWTWAASWLQRCIFQVTFFALVGTLLGSRHMVEYMLVGNAVYLGATTSAFAIQNAAWERYSGTLPLLVASPARPFVAFLGRSSQNVPNAIVTALATLLIVGVMFDLPLVPVRVLAATPLIVLVTITAYLAAVCVGAIAVRWPASRNLTANVFMSSMLILCGVNYPIDAMPQAAQVLASTLPVSHGLEAIRVTLAGGPVTEALRLAAIELAVGLGWFVAAAATFDRLVEGGRRSGSIEFGS